MRVQRTFDVALVYGVMTIPELFNVVTEDGDSPSEFVPDVAGECWLTVYHDNSLVALYRLRRVNSVTMEIHINVLPQYRKTHSLDTGKAVLEWIDENAPWCRKLSAFVPELYPNVRAFAEKMGFEHEGTDTASHLKNGKLHDRWLLGMKRGNQDG